jgi:hypothetical protein
VHRLRPPWPGASPTRPSCASGACARSTSRTPVRRPPLAVSRRLTGRAGLPHANYAPSEAHPYGSTEDGYAEKVKRQTVLEQHVNYWDRDNDGQIWPMDTFRGFRELGCVSSSFETKRSVLK